MDRGLLQHQMVMRDQIRFCQGAGHHRNQDTHKTHKHPYFIPIDVPVFAQWPRHDHLEEIQPVSEDNQHCDEGNREVVSFTWAGHQYQERHNEVDQEVGVEDDAVRSLLPQLKVNRFIRDIGIPNQHILSEPQVRPED